VPRAVPVVLLLAVAACRSPSSESAGRQPSSGSAAATATADAAATAEDAAVDAAVIDAPLASIVDWPIAWPPSRDQAMLAYRRAHSDAAAVDTAITPGMIVLHYTAGGSAKATKGYFDRLHLEASRAKLREGGDVNVAAHFLVDRDGTIYRLMPETRMARHAIGVNHVAIGVENVGDEDKWPLTDAQVDANVALVRDLVARHPTITMLAGHHEVRLLEGTSWFVERDPTYRNKKPDPGDRFMAAVRAKLSDLSLERPAENP
jgi:hypothetical protein